MDPRSPVFAFVQYLVVFNGERRFGRAALEDHGDVKLPCLLLRPKLATAAAATAAADGGGGAAVGAAVARAAVEWRTRMGAVTSASAKRARSRAR